MAAQGATDRRVRLIGIGLVGAALATRAHQGILEQAIAAGEGELDNSAVIQVLRRLRPPGPSGRGLPSATS